jgi:hypothetical protein
MTDRWCRSNPSLRLSCGRSSDVLRTRSARPNILLALDGYEYISNAGELTWHDFNTLNATGRRSWQLDDCFVRLDLDNRLKLPNPLSFFDQPPDNLSLVNSFANVGKSKLYDHSPSLQFENDSKTS